MNITKNYPLGVIEPVIGTLFPTWECKQTWLRRNFVSTINVISSQFPAYEKRQ